MRWLDSITDSMNMNLSELSVKNKEGWRAAVHGIAKSQTQLNNKWGYEAFECLFTGFTGYRLFLQSHQVNLGSLNTLFTGDVTNEVKLI